MAGYEEFRSSTNEALAQLVQDGNEQAMRLLLHRLTNPIWRFLQNRGATDLEAEEVTAESLDLMFSKIGQFKGQARLFSWVCSIAWHCFLRRRAGLQPEFVPIEECYKIPGDAALEPDELARRREQVRLCQSYLDELTPEQRNAVTLVELEGMTLKEAAAVMDTTLGSVAMALDRAKRRMCALAARPADRARLTRKSRDDE
jgi:RNA polymerase sigma-70 factor (ECF subfamily)